MVNVNVISVLIVLNFYTKISGAQSLNEIDFKMVRDLAKEIGDELLQLSETVTKRAEVQESFSHAKVMRKNGPRIVDEIAKDLEVMLGIRVDALKRIARKAQNLDKVSDNVTVYENYTFINMRIRDKHKSEIDRERDEKNAIKEKMSQDPNYKKKKKPNYDSPTCIKSTAKKAVEEDDSDDDDDEKELISSFNETINMKTKQAGVYLPLDVYDKAQETNISMIIERTKALDAIFYQNYQNEPTIGWQYFCNSSGMFRHFPATSWDFQPMNIYDCRMRHWYTNAASSSKDVIILIEQSGSMRGTRLDIAIDVVRNILDTLTINDFVNVFSFNDTIRCVIDCADHTLPFPPPNPMLDRLIQATSSNIYDLKQALNDIEPNDQSDLAEALKHAFEVLQSNRRKGANCNQVIMLITDGMEYNETIQNIFREYNWNKGNPARVFSFLIGEMIPENDYEQVKLMACENRGYYVQIDTKTETREQVLKYIPVMARPLAFNRTQSPVVWSQVYADILDPYRITNYDWNCKQNVMQKARAVKYLKTYEYYPCIDEGEDDEVENFRKYVFMTTVSMPALEQREIQPQLMGVAAIDVPLYEFERLFQQFRLGVNGYAFVIDENGNILTHPDFRPLFQNGLLKPSYNSIDLVEVELTDDDTEAARDYNFNLISMRAAMIDNNPGSKVLSIIQHYDDLRRVMRFKRHYYWKKVDKTPFTVVVTFSDNLTGQVQIPEHEVDSMTKGNKIQKLFDGNYRLHPDWIYCRSLRKNFEDLKLGEIDPDDCEMTPEEELEYYIEKFEKSSWKWKSSSTKDKGAYKCDQKLMQALLFDAKATENFPNKPNKNTLEKFKIKSSFIATHSGLLRFKIYEEDERENKIKSVEFAKKFKKTIEEDWYKHTVEFNNKEPKSFVYSVPFDASFKLEPEKELITATTTIFTRDGGERSPLAVVGFQFEQEKLLDLFGAVCAPHVEQVCFILDDNAYIVAHSRKEHVGKFLGSVENKIMRLLMEENIYEDVTIFDYQAVCYENRNKKYEAIMDIMSSASRVFMSPLKFLWQVLVVMASTMWKLAVAAKEYLPNLMYPDPEYYYVDDLDGYCPYEGDGSLKQCLDEEGVSLTDTTHEHYEKCMKNYTKREKACRDDLRWSRNLIKRHLNRTRPRRCDKFNYVYVLNLTSNFGKPYSNCERPFVVHRIPNTNLILLIAKSDCAKNIYYEFYDAPSDVTKYKVSQFCRKMDSPLYRRHSKYCFSHHNHEPSFVRGDNRTNICGHGNRVELQSILKLIIPLLIAIVIKM